MQINSDASKCVVFIGFADDRDEIRIVGTGFFVTYRNHGYLVTAKHVASTTAAYAAEPLDHASFMVRLNQNDGTAKNVEVMDIRWVFHPDEDVDLAVVAFEPDRLSTEYDCRYLPQTTLLREGRPMDDTVGIGDVCYAIDLCRMLRGKKRNLPVVHSGNVVLVPDAEKIPVRNWDDEEWLPPKYVEVYLVEFPGLIGMAGSPIFVRPCWELAESQSAERRLNSNIACSDLFVLGVFQAAWNAPPNEILTSSPNRSNGSAAGIGVVIPSERIFEVLELPELQEARAQLDRHRRLNNPAAITLAIPEKPGPRAHDGRSRDGKDVA